MYWYLENDREELVGGRKDQILRQPQLRARHKGLAILIHPENKTNEKSSVAEP
jgi:hypothetical protein